MNKILGYKNLNNNQMNNYAIYLKKLCVNS